MPLNHLLKQVYNSVKEPSSPAPSLVVEKANQHRELDKEIAANSLRNSQILSTCHSYRQARRDFYELRKGRYNRLSYLKQSHTRNERFKQSNWLMFMGTILGHRKAQVYNWCPDKVDAEHVISQISDPLDPWKGVRWPWYSSCRINPIPTDPELTLRYRPEVFSTQSALISQLKYHKQMVKKLTLELNN